MTELQASNEQQPSTIANAQWENLLGEQVPVLLLVFNRPEETRRVVESLRQVRPGRLFVAGDGPRFDHPEDHENCRLTRQAAKDIDWPCDLQTRFLETNIGCGPGVSSGIGWFFGHVEYGIILEDDCVPHPSFFEFCGELFRRYSQDERIMQISGFAPYSVRDYPYDYHFSRAFRCWGWGTWRRAWKHFSLSLEQYGDWEAREFLRTYYPGYWKRRPKYLQFWEYKKGVPRDVWDFQWNVACYAQNALCIVPERNLVENIGFNDNATHTSSTSPVFANLETHPIASPMRHPPFVYPDGLPEQSLEKAIYDGLSFKGRFVQQLRHAVGAFVDFFDSVP